MAQEQLSTEALLQDTIGDYFADPLGHVMFSYPWDSDPAIQILDWTREDLWVNVNTGFMYEYEPEGIETITYAELMEPYCKRFPGAQFGPDKWACDFLDEVGREVHKRGFKGFKAVDPIKMVTASGHGIGKSVLVSWLIKWIMDTRPYAKGTVTANTETQLRTKTWAELGKWHRRSMTEHWFIYNSGRGSMSLKHKKHLEEWYCSAQTCREENSEAFAGQHAANSTSFYIFDEAGGIPGKIFEVRGGGTVTGEPMVFDFGNPTRNSGEFYEECEGKLRHRFIIRKIDNRTVAITNKKNARELIEDFGIDSDRVKVRVRGEFPSAGSTQFMNTAQIKRAMIRDDAYNRFATVTIGVDVARFGDDNSVIYPVMGRDARSFAPKNGDGIYSGLDNVQLAHKVMAKVEEFRAKGVEVAALFVDVTGTGSGVVDTLNHSGYAEITIPINFGNSPVFDGETYRYRGDEMWGRARKAIKTDLIMPRLPEYVKPSMIGHNGGPSIDENEGRSDTATQLLAELTQREFGYTLSGNKIHLETKKDMKARGVRSPDIADAFVLNFAQDVAPSQVAHGAQSQGIVSKPDHDPIANTTVH